jgi:secreted trypsin-like serine protease
VRAFAWLAAGLVLSGPASAAAELSPRVIGGAPVVATSATVALRTSSGRLVCSGVLHSARVVLTAAHCIVDEQAHGIADACVGPSIASCSATARVVRVVRHPDYDGLTFEHDLALVVLEASLPAPIARVGEEVTVDERLRTEGYGRSEADSADSAGTLRARELRVTAVDATRIVLEEGTCRGDSGGPAYRGADVIALTSSGPVGCRDFGRSTRIAPYREWIESTLSESRAPGGCGSPRCAPDLGALAVVASALALLGITRVRESSTNLRESPRRSA